MRLLIAALVLCATPVYAQTAVTRTSDDALRTVNGTTSDAAVAPGSTGTDSGKLRQISDDTADVSTNTDRAADELEEITSNLVASACDDRTLVTSFSINLGAATGTTLITAGEAGVTKHVCGIFLTFGGASIGTVIAGTDSTCSTSTKVLTYVETYAAEPAFNQNGNSPLFSGDTADAICITRTSSVSARGYISIAGITEP